MAIIVKMGSNLWRTLMIYDEGEALFKSFKNGDGGSFSSAT